MGTVMGGDDV